MNRFVISLLMLLTGSFLSAQNLSFSYAEIAHVNDVQPSFVSGYGGDLVVSVGVSGNGDLDVANTVASSFGSSGITLAGVRCTGFDGEFTLYDVTLHIPAMPSNTFARTLSFHGSEDLSSLSSRQSWETMRGTVSGTGHENLFPGQHFTVSVSGVDRNVAYTLYQDDGFTRFPVETRSSNRYNGTINFDVDEPGTYIVGNGLQFCRGMVHAYQANFFERGFMYLEAGGSTFRIPADGGRIDVRMDARDRLPVDVFTSYVGLLADEMYGQWDSHLGIEIKSIFNDGRSVILTLTAGPNLSSSAYVGDTGFPSSSGTTIRFVQPTGGRLIPFLVWGSAGEGRTLVANVSGSQLGVRYDMVRSGEEVPGISSANGTGERLTIESRDTLGAYEVYAIYDDGYSIYHTKRMQGTVSLPPAMPDPLSDHSSEYGNWVKEYTYLSPDGDYVVDATYYNGLGFSEQTVQQDYASVCGRQTWMNKVSVTEYDNMLNPETRVPLPFAVRSSSVSSCENPDEEQRDFYRSAYGEGDIDFLCSGTDHEQTSRERPLRSFRPGRSYQDASRFLTHSYGLNSDAEVPDGSGGFFPGSSLLRHTVEDEEGRTVSEYQDAQGHIRLHREMLEDGVTHDILYSYDSRDRLSHISSGITYRYDEFGRVAQKQISPGEWTTYLYDDADRVVLEIGRETWRRYIYDPYGRIVSIHAKSGPWVGYDTIRDSLSNCAPGSHPLDDFGGVPISEYEYSSYRGGELVFEDRDGTLSQRLSRKTRGMVTYERHLVLDAPCVENCSGIYVERAFFYDLDGRVLQSVEKTQLGSILRRSYTYDFRGNVLTEHVSHCVEGRVDVLDRTYIYDCRDRCIASTEAIPGISSASVCRSYDWAGRECDRAYTSSVPLCNDVESLESSFSYDIQGRLSEYGDTLFRQSLLYESSVPPGIVPRYDGKVSSTTWRHGDMTGRYAYGYDLQGRLVSADSDEGGVSEHISYLPDGRLSGIGHSSSDGSQLDSLHVDGSGVLPSGLSDFGAGDIFQDLIYDAMGRQTYSGREDRSISYNILNLPCYVETLECFVNYSYLSDGNKCGVMDSSLNGYEYIGPFVYSRDGENLTLSSADMSCGRFVRVPGQDGLVPEYWSMDYLGSVRARDTAGEVRFYDYTPYGSLWNTSLPSSGDNPHGFNGKEFQSFDSVNLYDYGARMYSPVIPMWTTPDPLFEKNHTVNPLSFCAGDPVNYVDPDGRDIWILEQNGKLIWVCEAEYNRLYAVDDKGYYAGHIDVSCKKALKDLSMIFPAKSNKSHSISYTDMLETKEAFNLFEFCADHTKVEWAIHVGKETVVGTVHEELSAGCWEDYGMSSVPGISIHSHPGVSRKFRESSMGIDYANLRNDPRSKAKSYFIYFPELKEYSRLTINGYTNLSVKPIR